MRLTGEVDTSSAFSIFSAAASSASTPDVVSAFFTLVPFTSFCGARRALLVLLGVSFVASASNLLVDGGGKYFK